jgi:hypothetical protein
MNANKVFILILVLFAGICNAKARRFPYQLNHRSKPQNASLLYDTNSNSNTHSDDPTLAWFFICYICYILYTGFTHRHL